MFVGAGHEKLRPRPRRAGTTDKMTAAADVRQMVFGVPGAAHELRTTAKKERAKLFPITDLLRTKLMHFLTRD